MLGFCTTCKGRLNHLALTLPQNLEDCKNGVFIILDYADEPGLADMIKSEHTQDLDSGRLVYYRTEAPKFHMAHAKNMAHRLGMREGANILVTLDADNWAGIGFDQFILDRFRENNIFLCPKVIGLGSGAVRVAPRGVAGRLAVSANNFIKAGGYDEKYDTWRGEDVDIVARLRRMGYAPRFIDPMYLDAIRHGSGLRFKEYPHAQAYENDAEVRLINEAKHTVVNFGDFGCGVAYRNFGDRPIVLRPLPTRVFGIGLHKTATTSLDQAFQMLGFDSFHWHTGDKARDIWNEMTTLGQSWTLERYYALSDLPIPLLYRHLDIAYPGSKFILTVREEGEWLKSVEHLWDRRYNPTRWEWDVYPFSNLIHRELYGRIDFHAETFLARYRQHNAEVKAYFKGRSDLLIMDFSKSVGWKELCSFLDQPLVHAPFPHLHKSERNG